MASKKIYGNVSDWAYSLKTGSSTKKRNETDQGYEAWENASESVRPNNTYGNNNIFNASSPYDEWNNASQIGQLAQKGITRNTQNIDWKNYMNYDARVQRRANEKVFNDTINKITEANNPLVRLKEIPNLQKKAYDSITQPYYANTSISNPKKSNPSGMNQQQSDYYSGLKNSQDYNQTVNNYKNSTAYQDEQQAFKSNPKDKEYQTWLSQESVLGALNPFRTAATPSAFRPDFWNTGNQQKNAEYARYGKYMSDDEANTFYYLKQKSGDKEAQKYFDLLKPDLYTRYQETLNYEARKEAKNNPAAAAYANITAHLSKGIAPITGEINNGIRGAFGKAPQAVDYSSTAVEKGTSQGLTSGMDRTGKIAFSIGTGLGKIAADAAAGRAIGGALGIALGNVAAEISKNFIPGATEAGQRAAEFFATKGTSAGRIAGADINAASNSLYSTAGDGTKNQGSRLALAAEAGAYEAVKQKILSDDMNGLIQNPKYGLKEIFGAIGKSTIKGAELGGSEQIVNEATDYVFNGKNSNWNRTIEYYKSLGQDEKTAKASAAAKFATDFANVTAVNAGEAAILSGLSIAYGRYIDNRFLKQNGMVEGKYKDINTGNEVMNPQEAEAYKNAYNSVSGEGTTGKMVPTESGVTEANYPDVIKPDMPAKNTSVIDTGLKAEGTSTTGADIIDNVNPVEGDNNIVIRGNVNDAIDNAVLKSNNTLSEEKITLPKDSAGSLNSGVKNILGGSDFVILKYDKPDGTYMLTKGNGTDYDFNIATLDGNGNNIGNVQITKEYIENFNDGKLLPEPGDNVSIIRKGKAETSVTEQKGKLDGIQNREETVPMENESRRETVNYDNGTDIVERASGYGFGENGKSAYIATKAKSSLPDTLYDEGFLEAYNAGKYGGRLAGIDSYAYQSLQASEQTAAYKAGVQDGIGSKSGKGFAKIGSAVKMDPNSILEKIGNGELSKQNLISVADQLGIEDYQKMSDPELESAVNDTLMNYHEGSGNGFYVQIESEDNQNEVSETKTGIQYKAKAYADKAEKQYGTTFDFRKSGYIDTNGNMIDFSQGNRSRTLDHRNISTILDLPENSNYSDGMIQFMNMGNIRMNEWGIDVASAPGTKQVPALKRFISNLNGEFTVDFSDKNGDNIYSIEYPEGTKPDRIINDIRNYYQTGKEPVLSETEKFHVSDKNSNIEGQLTLDFGISKDEATKISAAAKKIQSNRITSTNNRIKTIGKDHRIIRSMLKTGSVSLVGEKISSTNDLADLAQVYRDPRFETAHYFFMDKNNRVVLETGVTSRIPNLSMIVPSNTSVEDYVKNLAGSAKKAGAVSYYLQHNHPSGDPTASRDDYRVSTSLGEMFAAEGIENNGHIIIDHTKYGFIKPNGDFELHEVSAEFQREILKKGMADPFDKLNGNVTYSNELAEYAIYDQRDQNRSVLLFSDNKLKTKIIQSVPDELVKDYDRFSKYVHKTAVNEGMPFAFIVTGDKAVYDRCTSYVIDNILLDAVKLEDNFFETSKWEEGIAAEKKPSEYFLGREHVAEEIKYDKKEERRNDFGLKEYPERQKGWDKKDGSIIYPKNKNDLVSIIKAKKFVFGEHGQYIYKLGIIDKELGESIKKWIGIDLTGGSFELQSEDIKHLLDNHGENGIKIPPTHKELAVSAEDIANVALYIKNAYGGIDAGKTHSGEEGYKFFAEYNGNMDIITLDYIVGKKNKNGYPGTLRLKTMFKLKKSITTAATSGNSSSLPQTSKTHDRISSSNNNIPQNGTGDNIVSENNLILRESSDYQQKKDQNLSDQIAHAMTNEQCKRMIQDAFYVGNIKDSYDGKYRNGEEWIRGEGTDDVSMVVENDENLQRKYIDRISGILNEDFEMDDVLEFYLKGKLSDEASGIKTKRIDVSAAGASYEGTVYSPLKTTDETARSMFKIANEKASGRNKEDVNAARAFIVKYAHNSGAAEQLGISNKELNQNLRKWSSYPTSAKEKSMLINGNVDPENRWTGIENCSLVNKYATDLDELKNIVGEVTGNTESWQRKSIMETILALDTHIEYKGLNFKFVSEIDDANGKNVLGYYDHSKNTITVKSYALETVSHEMGHYLDHLWGSELGYGMPISDGNFRNRLDLLSDPEQKQFMTNFYNFMDDLNMSAENRSIYRQTPTEIFARFTAKFVTWANNTAAGNHIREDYFRYDNDKFTEKQFVEFARLLQEKSKIGRLENIREKDSLSPNDLQTSAASREFDIDDSGSFRTQLEMMDAKETLERVNNAAAEAIGVDRNTVKLTQNDISEIAKKYIKQYDSSVEPERLTQWLSNAFSYMYSSQEKAAFDIVPVMATYMKDVIRKGSYKDTSLMDTYKNTLVKDVRNYRFKISDQDKADLGEPFGEFKRRNFGNIKFSNEGYPIDTIYQELAEKYGEWFNPENVTHPADQLLDIARVMDEITNPEPMQYSEDIDEMATVTAWEVLQDYFGAKKINAATYNKAVNEAKAKLKMEYDLRFAEAKKNQIREIAEIRKQMAEAGAKEREKYQEQIKKLTDENSINIMIANMRWEKKLEKMKIRRFDTEATNKLMRQARMLSRMKGGPEFVRAKNELIGNLDLLSKGLRKQTRLNLSKLRQETAILARTDPNYLEDKNLMLRFAELDQKQINDLTPEQVAELTQAIIELRHGQQIANRMIKYENGARTAALGIKFINELEKTKGTKATKIHGKIDRFIVSQLNAEWAFNKLMDWQKDSVLSKLGKDINDGQTRMLDFRMRSTRMFDSFVKDTKFINELKKPTIKCTDTNGQSFMITPAMRISIYLHSLNEQNKAHMGYGGMTVPNMKEYAKGNIINSYEQDSQKVILKPEAIKNITSQMTDKEKEFAKVAWTFFNETSKEAINEVSELLNGYDKAIVSNYFPIKTDKNFNATKIEGLIKDGTIEGMGMLKERVDTAKSPILLEDVTNVIMRQIENTSKYYGLAIPIRNFNQVYSFTATKYAASVKSMLAQKWGDIGKKYIENLLTDLQEPRRNSDVGGFAQAYGKLRGNFAGGVLNGNVSVALKQTSSYPTGAAVVGWGPVLKAISHYKDSADKDVSLIEKYTPYLWTRKQGNSTVELGDIANKSPMFNKNNTIDQVQAKLKLIQNVDVRTAKTLWYAAEYYVQGTYPNLEEKSVMYYKKTAEVFNEIMMHTQQNYTAMQLPDVIRANDVISKTFTMFKGQALLYMGILEDASGNYEARKRDYLYMKNHPEMSDKNANLKAAADDLDAARQKFVRSWTAVGISNVMNAIMGLATAIILHNMTKYRDKNGRITVESIAEGMFEDFLSATFGMIMFGSELYDAIVSTVSGRTPFDIDVPGITSINDMAQSTSKLAEEIVKAITDDSSPADVKRDKVVSALVKAGMSLSVVKGIGLQSVKRIAESAWNYAIDYRNGELGTFNAGSDINQKQYSNRMFEDLYNNSDKEQFEKDREASGMEDKKIEEQMKNRLIKTDEIKQAAEQLDRGDLKGYKESISELNAKGFDTDTIKEAITSVQKSNKKSLEETKTDNKEQKGTEESKKDQNAAETKSSKADTGIFTKADLYVAYDVNGPDSAIYKEIYDQYKKDNGKTDKQMQTMIKAHDTAKKKKEQSKQQNKQ